MGNHQSSIYLRQARTLLQKYRDWIVLHPTRSLLLMMSAAGLLCYALALPGVLFHTPYSTVIEDAKGRLLGARIADDGQWRFPEPDSLPQKYVQALVTYEDSRFFYHPGFDPIALGRAMLQNLRKGHIVSGGSTISMQVIRLSRNGRARSIPEKAIEVLLSTRLELKYSKERILRLYASQAPFGGNIVGIEAAAWRYFGKPPVYISWAEAALLAILPNSPGLIHPGRNRDALLQKRNRLLRKLHADRKLDALALELALSEPLPEAPLPLPQLAPHLLQRAAREIPGKRVKSSIQANLQEQALEVCARHHRLLKFDEIHNLAALIVHVPSGRVLAYIGNAPGTGATHGEQVDITTAPRSTGSIIKPLLYALALQDGNLLPGSLLPDIPMNINGYHPQNFQPEFDGMVPANAALSRSLNIPFVHLLRQYGVGRYHYKLKKLGLSTITRSPDHYGLSLILGGAEATLWDLAGMYSGMARTLQTFNTQSSTYHSGDFRKLDYLRGESTPARGNQSSRKPFMIGAGALWSAFEAMQEVGRPASEGEWQYFSSSRRIAWKTGTSFGFRDAWSIGLTPEFLVATWVGNADGVGRPELIGTQVAAPLMFELFGLLPATSWFAKPYDDLRKQLVCRNSGWPAGRYCPADTVFVPRKGNLAPACRYHTLIHLNPERTFQVNAGCQPTGKIVHESWFVLPTLEEYYFRKKNPDYLPLPPFRSDCASIAAQSASANSPMQLIYPTGKARIYIPRDLDGSMSATVFKLAHRNPDARVYWHIDNVFLGTTQTFHHFELRPAPGAHLLTLIDADGNRLERTFEVAEK